MGHTNPAANREKKPTENELHIQELCQKLEPLNETEVRKVLQAVLHSLRDRLSLEQSAHFAKSIPASVRKTFNDDWKKQVPTQSTEGFLRDVGKRLDTQPRKTLQQEVHNTLKHIHDWLRTTELKNLPVLQEAIRELGQAGV